jgi:hypothetical protein
MNILEQIAVGVGNINQNVVDLYKLVSEQQRMIDELHAALFKDLTVESTEEE